MSGYCSVRSVRGPTNKERLEKPANNICSVRSIRGSTNKERLEKPANNICNRTAKTFEVVVL